MHAINYSVFLFISEMIYFTYAAPFGSSCLSLSDFVTRNALSFGSSGHNCVTFYRDANCNPESGYTTIIMDRHPFNVAIPDFRLAVHEIRTDDMVLGIESLDDFVGSLNSYMCP